KQKEILLFIKEKREIESNLIARKFKSPYAQIKKLIEKEWIYKEKREIFTNSIKDPGLSYGKKITLTEPQKKALNKIEEALNLKIFSPFLLYGITGSGKTEVYLAAFEKVLKKGGKGLLLVPEIALTPQLLSRFKNRLNTEIALLHSGLSTRERFDQWMRIKRGEISMVIGARSALFAPFSSLDLIVVDEEHDTAYKQEEGVKYHARDMALVLGKMVNAVVLLGSATPSVESFYNCEIGKFNLLSLPERPGISSLPEIEIVDIRRTKNDSQFLSKKLIAALKENLKKREQSMLFLNRRGFAPFVLCRSCGEVPRCPNCSVSLTLHRDLKKLLCHYCGYSTDFSNLCPVCKKEELIPVGMGTEQIEKKLKDIFPEATIKRMDKDTVKKRNSLTNILKALREKEIDILIGTQMIIKGHDYPNVTLVGILLADLSLNFPDFRSGEKTFQLLTQAAGRAGRGEKKGKVVIQTFNPFNPIIRMATTQDYLSFYKEEIKFRKELNYPPYSRLALIKFSTNNKQILFEGFNIIKETAEKMVKESLNIEIIGPSFAPLSKLKGRHRGQILIKGKNSSTIHRFLKKFIKMIEKRVGKSIEIKIDVDPYNML
ncbi:MAG: primosomal protein N', partial [Deltaproteobacteria bacterium]